MIRADRATPDPEVPECRKNRREWLHSLLTRDRFPKDRPDLPEHSLVDRVRISRDFLIPGAWHDSLSSFSLLAWCQKIQWS